MHDTTKFKCVPKINVSEFHLKKDAPLTINTTGQTTETRKSQDVATLTRDMNSETNEVKNQKPICSVWIVSAGSSRANPQT
jgi:hypothetical protein